jgi:hypothetical protein
MLRAGWNREVLRLDYSKFFPADAVRDAQRQSGNVGARLRITRIAPAQILGTYCSTVTV